MGCGSVNQRIPALYALQRQYAVKETLISKSKLASLGSNCELSPNEWSQCNPTSDQWNNFNTLSLPAVDSFSHKYKSGGIASRSSLLSNLKLSNCIWSALSLTRHFSYLFRRWTSLSVLLRLSGSPLRKIHVSLLLQRVSCVSLWQWVSCRVLPSFLRWPGSTAGIMGNCWKASMLDLVCAVCCFAHRRAFWITPSNAEARSDSQDCYRSHCLAF
jgi:hypothetical protein